MRGMLVDSKMPVRKLELGNYIIEARLASGNMKMSGGLIIQTGPDEFICTGRGLDVFFSAKDITFRTALDIVDEGTFRDGEWIPERRLNGDETHATTFDGAGLRLPEERISIQKVSLYKYK